MPLDAATVLAIAAACAPDVAPSTLLAIARVESALDPLAIGVNGAAGRRPRAARTRDEATRTAAVLLASGADLDLGLAQINSRNLARLGLSVSEAFEPCTNLRAAAEVLTAGYHRARGFEDQQVRLRIALSLYNTGHPRRGFRNGYVDRVTAAAGRGDPGPPGPQPIPPAAAPPPAPWRVFHTGAVGDRPFVLSFQTGDRP